MAIYHTKITKKVKNYAFKNSFKKNNIETNLIKFNKLLKISNWQTNEEIGQLICFLIKLTKAKKTLEIGVFTGYSSLITAMSLPDNGKIIACESDSKWTKIARFFWKMAGVKNKIDLKIAPAEKTLDNLIKSGESETFDFVFIDADKDYYENYYEKSLQLVKQNGLIIIDNILWKGKVAYNNFNDYTTNKIRILNKKIKEDKRVDATMLLIADGIFLIRKK